jgi:hypothetical protein
MVAVDALRSKRSPGRRSHERLLDVDVLADLTELARESVFGERATRCLRGA